MARKPLLIFPKPTSHSKDSLTQFRGNLRFASKEKQVEHFEQRITDLERVLENQNAYLGTNPSNLVSEMILVLEIAGDIKDFFNAVAATPGMEFLSIMHSEFEPDDDVYVVDLHGDRTNKTVGARLFLTMTNQRALQQLQSYWIEYKKDVDQVFVRRTGKFKNLFDQLKDLRPYSVADRIFDTGLESYLDDMRELGIEAIRFEVELAFKNDAQKDERAFTEVNYLLTQNAGRIIKGSRTVLPEIYYHAFIAEAPIDSFQDLTENTNVTFLQSQQVLFFRPVGQSIFKLSEEPIELDYDQEIPDREISGEPVIALFDGLPLQNHALLANSLIIDDPDNFELAYQGSMRVHGTAMASLIINGDLGEEQLKLPRPIYVRPILKPLDSNFGVGEFLPNDKLPIDLIHRSVRRMFEGEGNTPPTAPLVKIINFSIGDPFRPFNLNLSTWAKLIDWLSYKYNVLFIISAGNKTDKLILDIPSDQFENADPLHIEIATLKRIIENNYDWKILTPAESINSISVGCSHHDCCEPINSAHRKNVIQNRHLLSPISRIGFGYNTSVKPEILMPGGIKLFRKPVLQTEIGKTVLTLEEGASMEHPPGNLVALPGLQGQIHKVGYLSGTSNAAALTSNLAARLYEMLIELNDELSGEQKIPLKFFTVIIKALLVHSSTWGEAQTILEDIIRNLPGISPQTLKKNVIPYLGYGSVDSEKILYCTDHRVTLIGFGELTKRDGRNAHLYSFPLPPSIGAINIDKKLAITLAWLSPLNFKTSQYRRAHLFFDNLEQNGHLTLSRPAQGYSIGKKGTVQHDVLTGSHADVFIDGESLTIKVSCREDASGLPINEAIPYALTVTLEIRENVHTLIYEEIQQRLQQRIRERV